MTTESKLVAPAALRNREPIGDVLARVLPAHGRVLVIAEGSGEHVSYFAGRLPHVTWQPTDIHPASLESIGVWQRELGLPCFLPPLRLDVTETPWPVETADAIVCINMIHIAPWEATLGLFAGAARLLAPGALLYLYGPYQFRGIFTAPSNEEFDRSLRSRNPTWGVRDVEQIHEVARSDFSLHEVTPMPANNHSLIFRRT